MVEKCLQGGQEQNVTKVMLKVLKDKSAKDISLSMYLVMFTGVVLWLVYGLHHNSAPIIFANVITSVLTLAVIVLKLKYK